MSAAWAWLLATLSCGSIDGVAGKHLPCTLSATAGALALFGAGANDNSPNIRQRSANVKSTKTMICPLKD
jgi:hypothetical protein